MNKNSIMRLARGLFGKEQVFDLVPEDKPGRTGGRLPLRAMIEHLLRLSGQEFGMYAWTREPLEGKFDTAQKMGYILKAESCGMNEARLLKREYCTDGVGGPADIARLMGLKVETPDIPTGGGHVIFAQYAEPDEITIFTDAVDKAERLIEEHSLRDLLGAADIKSLLLAHEIFHAVEYRKKDSIYTKIEKVELWRKPFSNQSGLACLGEIAAMAFAREMVGAAFSPYLLDVLFMYGYHQEAAEALFDEIMEIAGKKTENEEDLYVDKQVGDCRQV